MIRVNDIDVEFEAAASARSAQPLPVENGQPRASWLPMLAVFVTALCLRFLYITQYPQTPIAYDAEDFVIAAEDLVQKGIFPSRPQGPGYPVFLGLVFSLFGSDPWPVRYLQAGMDSATCIIIYLLAKRLAGSRAAFFAGIFTAVCPGLILHTGYIHTETLSTFILWSGILLLVRSRSLESRLGLAGSAFLIACASLTRPNLTPALPLLIASVAGSTAGTFRKRCSDAGFFAAVLIGLLIGWNILAGALGVRATVGGAGFVHLQKVLDESPHPNCRGWCVDGVMEEKEPWSQIVRRNFFYPVASAASLVMHHLWFSDNIWRQAFLLSPAGMDHFQRALFLLGLSGLGLALSRKHRARFAPVLAILAGLAFVAVKWIEIRPCLPFLPALFILGGLFCSSVADRLTDPAGAPGIRRGAVIGALASFTLIYFTQFEYLARFFPNVHPMILGRIGDFTILGVTVFLGFLAYLLFKARMVKRQAALSAFLPAGVFVLLFGSYMYVESEPRWLAWKINLAELSTPIVQEFDLPKALPIEEIDSVALLLDLETNACPPTLQVEVNGDSLSRGQPQWQRLHCPDGDNSYLCPAYRKLTGFTGRPLEHWPQWWFIPIEPAKLSGRSTIRCTLSVPERSSNHAEPVALNVGGTFVRDNLPGFTGPSLIQGGNTSLYRWEVLEDWRLWETTPVWSIAVSSRLECAEHTTHSGQQGAYIPLPVLANWLNGNQAGFNVRLIVRYKDGRYEIY